VGRYWHPDNILCKASRVGAAGHSTWPRQRHPVGFVMLAFVPEAGLIVATPGVWPGVRRAGRPQAAEPGADTGPAARAAGRLDQKRRDSATHRPLPSPSACRWARGASCGL